MTEQIAHRQHKTNNNKTTSGDFSMQNADFFFQNADYRHLFLYIDGLAETEARRQNDVSEYASKRLEDIDVLQKRIAFLEQELTQEREANTLLQAQIGQECRKAALLDSLLADKDDTKAAAKADLCGKMAFLYQKFQETLTFPMLQNPSSFLSSAKQAREARKLYLQHVKTESMNQILLCAQNASIRLQSLDAFTAQCFSPITLLQQYFEQVSNFLDAASNMTDKKDLTNVLDIIKYIKTLKHRIEKKIIEQKRDLEKIFSIAWAFYSNGAELAATATDSELKDFTSMIKSNIIAQEPSKSRETSKPRTAKSDQNRRKRRAAQKRRALQAVRSRSC